jgi:hypothetical protein
MKKFEYDITKHLPEKFTQLVYFCSAEGDCRFENIPSDQMTVLSEVLDERGSEGWELIQLFFAKDGVVAFWKRAL